MHTLIHAIFGQYLGGLIFGFGLGSVITAYLVYFLTRPKQER